MNRENLIRHQIERLGVTVILKDGGWESVPYKAMVNPLWRRKSSNFENKYTELGGVLNEYYLYIGASNHDITKLSDDAVALIGDDRYEFKHKDSVKINDKTIYYTAILRKLKGED